MTLCWKTVGIIVSVGTTIFFGGQGVHAIKSKGINNEKNVEKLASATQISIKELREISFDNQAVNREQSVRIESSARIQSMVIEELKELRKSR